MKKTTRASAKANSASKSRRVRAKARSRSVGRPAQERISWDPETFKMVHSSTLVSMGALSEMTGFSRHVLYSWQSPSVARTPTRKQREKLAKVLSELTGSVIRAADLGKGVERIRFTFA